MFYKYRPLVLGKSGKTLETANLMIHVQKQFKKPLSDDESISSFLIKNSHLGAIVIARTNTN